MYPPVEHGADQPGHVRNQEAEGLVVARVGYGRIGVGKVWVAWQNRLAMIMCLGYYCLTYFCRGYQYSHVR